jgi:hypothetical protein
MLIAHTFQNNQCVLYGALKLKVTTLRIILDGAATTKTLGITKDPLSERTK